MQYYNYYTICENLNQKYTYIVSYKNGDIELLSDLYFEKGGSKPAKVTKDYVSYFIGDFSKKSLEKLALAYQNESHPAWYQISDLLKAMIEIGWIRKKTVLEVAQELSVATMLSGLLKKDYVNRVLISETSTPSFSIYLVGAELNRSPSLWIDSPYNLMQMSYTSRPLKASFAESLEALKKDYQVIVNTPYNVKVSKKCTG